MGKRNKILKFTGTIFFLLFSSLLFSISSAKEEKLKIETHHSQTEIHLEKGEEERKGQEKAEEEHPVETEHHPAVIPGTYYFYWLLLGMVFIILLAHFYLRVHAEAFNFTERYPEPQKLGIIFVLLVLTLFLTEQMPSLAGHFDYQKKIFLDGYHEDMTVSLIRFFYKMVVGVLLVVYAVSPRYTVGRTNEN